MDIRPEPGKYPNGEMVEAGSACSVYSTQLVRPVIYCFCLGLARIFANGGVGVR